MCRSLRKVEGTHLQPLTIAFKQTTCFPKSMTTYKSPSIKMRNTVILIFICVPKDTQPHTINKIVPRTQ